MLFRSRQEVSTKRATKHGMEGSPEYYVWGSMKDRCLNPNNGQYKDYGGRGIVVCRRWLDSFKAFFDDMGPRPTTRHTIERKDNQGGYSPENCIWATRKEQCRNKRDNRRITYKGETLCIAEWAEVFGMSSGLISSRINAGWTIHDVFTLSSDKQKGLDGRFIVRGKRE